jgi:hypoxanthine-DNA glycosylase
MEPLKGRLSHPFAPLYDGQSEILILGSFPSALSRETGFYYGNPRNRFWPLLALIYGERLPEGTPAKAEMILRRHLALYDVIASCAISNSADASIKEAEPTDLTSLRAPLRLVLLNGAAAGRFYERHQKDVLGLPYRIMPSTSPANAAYRLPRLAAAYGPFLLKKEGFGG